MEATVSEKRENVSEVGKAAGRKWGSLIFKFLMYGGWLVVVIVLLTVYTLISIYFK